MSALPSNTLLYHELSQRLSSLPATRDLLKRTRLGSLPVTVRGPKSGFTAYLIARMREELEYPLLVVVPSEQEAELLRVDLEVYGAPSLVLPSWQTAPYAPTSGQGGIAGQRARALAALAADEPSIVVAPLRATLQATISAERLHKRIVKLSVGAAIDPTRLGDQLASLGYWRVPKVGLGGEYAIRGEVVDVFPVGADYAIRVVYDFDTIAELREFDAATQVSVGTHREVRVHPAGEQIWDEDEPTELSLRTADWPELRGQHETLMELIESGRTSELGPHWYAAVPGRGSVIDMTGPHARVVWLDQARCRTMDDTIRKEYETVFAREHFSRPLPRPDRILFPIDELIDRCRTRSVTFESLADTSDREAIRFACDPPRSFFGNVAFLKEELSSLLASGNRVVVLSDTESQRRRIAYLLQEFEVELTGAHISGGFALPDVRFVVIQENEIFGRRRRAPASLKRVESAPIEAFVDLEEGDYVVHVNHGIGAYRGITRMQVGGNERDYIRLEYANEEMVFAPIEQVNLIQRYIGSGGAPPKLDYVGGKSWEKRKKSVQRNVEDLADRLIKLYAERQKVRGFAFPPDTEWQLEFESTFPFEETEDQLRCIDDVKRDMEKPQPMDRLVCGDVGYGKTEVAIRAAFKAVSSSKQVAFLTPTTILAEQHYERMLERFERFPVRVAVLSRFVPKQDQRAVLAGLADGSIDIVVGTHRLLQKDVRFRDLGLMVVDEEQRFGVKAKEQLKELKRAVDCLTLTATPIPRTLHMSLLQIRDMSLLQTAPYNRRPIETVIAEFDPETVSRAIRREVERGGQVFFLHNRIETLERVTESVRTLVPEVMVEFAHGQMSGTELEEIMHRFVHGAFQVLVATTIIENGIDIPNVNTIIIDRADMYGVSQLYQLRGRVGRSDRTAYAYLFYPEERALPEIAMKRLQIISDYTELGSGFKIAMKDLEVRGAGNLLGRQQSGDILSVGFDLYLRLLDEAIRDRQEGAERLEEDVYLELDYTGFIPDSYIADTMEKMEVYKRIAAVGSDIELQSLEAEIEDRFGPMPEEVSSLLAISEIRILARRLHLSSLRERGGELQVEFGEVAKVSVDRVLALIQNSGGSVTLDPKRPNVLKMKTGTVGLKEKSEFIRGRLAMLL